MALQRGPTYYPICTSAATDSPPAGVYDLSTTSGGSASVTLTGTTSATAPTATLFQVFPNGTTTIGSASAASTTLANNKGWQIPPTSSMGATATTPRVIPAGSTLTLQTFVRAIGLSGTATLTWSIYKRSSGGALTFIQALTGTNAAAVGNAGAVITFTGSAVASDIVFGAGETLYAEMYCSVPGETLTACTCQINIDTGSPFSVNNPNGIIYRTLATYSASAATSAFRVSNVKPGKSASVTLNAARSVSVGVFKSASSSVTAAAVKRLIRLPIQASISVVESDVFKIILVPKQASIATAAALQRTTSLFRSASVTATAAYAKSITKNIAASVTASAGIAKFLNLARKFSASSTVSASAVIGLPQTVLNRISGGAITTIKRIFQIVDD